MHIYGTCQHHMVDGFGMQLPFIMIMVEKWLWIMVDQTDEVLRMF
jgi:hypothetical protein